MTVLEFDDAESRRLESLYLTADVVAQRRAVLRCLAVQPGEQVLDIGVGPGLLAAEMALEAGPGGQIRGIDISESMLALARARASAAAGGAIEVQAGSAVDIPFDAERFDVVVSTQVLEYVADIPKALSECHRVLRRGGRVVVLDTDWDSIVWHNSDRPRMERVLRTWEQHLADPHLPRTLKRSLERAGFSEVKTEVVPLLNVGYQTATYSAGMMNLIADFVAGRDGITSEMADAWRSDLISLGPDYFFSLNRYLFAAAKPR